MFGNIYKSIINTSNFLWEPVGIVFALSLLWCIWRWRKNLRDPLPWCAVFGMLLAIVWRQHFHVTGGRYYGIFVVPVLFICFFTLWDILGKNKLRHCLLAAACAACLGRDLYYDPQDRTLMRLYRKVHDDAAGFARPVGMSYSKHPTRETFYTGIDVASSGGYRAPADLVLKQLDGNFRVWDGEYDAVYVFIELKRGMTIPKEWMTFNSRSGKVTLLGETWYDRHRRKRLAVLKYCPSSVPATECIGELIPNGDFQAVLSESENLKRVRYFGRRAKRFLQPGIILPQKWGIYHALTVKTDCVATVVRNGEKSALRMEANGAYLAAISPAFQVSAPRKLGFEVHAETGAELQLIRQIKFQGRGGNMYTILTLRLAPGTLRHYIITLPPFERDVQSRVWFWLNDGTVELSDVRLQ